MTDSTAAAHDADDARLLNMVRAGDPAAFGLLYERHEAAARRLADLLTTTADEADDLVAESFARVLEVTRKGGGPSNAVRPYLLTAVRRGYVERFSGQKTWLLGDECSLPAGPDQPFAELAEPLAELDTAEPLAEPDAGGRGLEATLMVRAYQSLPGSWRTVLWHAEIEQASPEYLAPLLGLDRNGTVALRREVTDGLRQACLRLYLSGTAKPQCTPVAERLGAFLRDAQSVGDTAMVTQHLTSCQDCRTVYEELADIRGTLRATVAPLVLGSAAGAYLAGARTDLTAATDDGSLEAALATGAPQGGGRLRQVPRPYRVLAAATAVALGAVALIATLAATSGGGSTPASNHHPAAAPSRSATVQASPSPSPSSASPAPAATPTAAQPAAADPAAVQPPLSATVSVSGQWVSGHVAQVLFQVTNNGPASTGALAASITLPGGASVLGFTPSYPDQPGPTGRHHRAAGWPQGTGWPLPGGWTCEPAGSTVTCSHNPIAAGGDVQGMLFVMIGASSACGQPVQLTVTSGPATAAAADIPC